MRKLDRFFYKHNIRNLSLYIVICYAFGYLLYAINPAFLELLTLNPERILHGQIWRLATWVLVPPDTSNVFFVLIACLFYYSIGTALERAWGQAQYTKYIFTGLFYTVVGAFLASFLAMPLYGMDFASAGYYTSRYFSTNYVMMSIFLAYAATFPDAQVLLFFLIPVRVRWLGILYAVLVGYEVITYIVPSLNLFGIFAIVASLLNFLIFYLRGRDFSRFSPKEVKRRADFKRAVQRGEREQRRGSAPFTSASSPESPRKMTPYRHKCAICGRTEVSNPELDFRYCSKCEGNYEFCQDHLFSHVHALNGNAPYIVPNQNAGTPGSTGNNGGNESGQE